MQINDDFFKNEKYIPMERCGYNWFFLDKDIPINNNDLLEIKPLTVEFCSYLWEKYISKKDRHLMLLSNDEWNALIPNPQLIYNWYDDWNNNIMEPFANMLKDTMNLPENAIIYYFWMKEEGVETKWGIFLKYWQNFLFEDEGPILINSLNNISIFFGPDGGAWIGERQN